MMFKKEGIKDEKLQKEVDEVMNNFLKNSWINHSYPHCGQESYDISYIDETTKMVIMNQVNIKV